LVDFLTSLLAKPQSYLREVANMCFKNFCVDAIEHTNLARLLEIISAPNKEAGDFMEGPQDNQKSDDDSDIELADESGVNAASSDDE
jgi:hypothetical protein